MTDTPDTSPEAVERFRLDDMWMAKDTDGTWVQYSDYAALSAEHDALITARDMMGEWWAKEKARAEAAEADLEQRKADNKRWRQEATSRTNELITELTALKAELAEARDWKKGRKDDE